MFVKKETYIKSAPVLLEVEKFKCRLIAANIGASILILLISFLRLFIFQVGCLIAWAWTLMRLYKDIQHSEKLLPKKRIFKLHGYLLTAYFLLLPLAQVL